MKFSSVAIALLTALGTVGLQTARLHAAGLTASDSDVGDLFGVDVSQSGSIGLVGASAAEVGPNSNQGSAYVFRSLNTATGNITQNVKLIASDGAGNDFFGQSVSLSGSIGLVGAVVNNGARGAAYVFRNLDTATGTTTQNVKLVASDGAANDQFGNSVSQSGGMGLVGAIQDEIGGNNNQGSAYLFRNLDTVVTGTISQNVKLTASDGTAEDFFGSAAGLSGNIGLVTALGPTRKGSAYVFRSLDTAAGNITQDVKLTASDGADNDFFGTGASLSGSTGLVGASSDDIGANNSQGSVYVFRNLDAATGSINENVKLIASDGAAGDNFGRAVSVSGSTGLVGAYHANIGANSDQGAAYLFRDLDTATGAITENVKLTASDGAANNFFGAGVGLDGDQFVIGAYGQSSGKGKAYTGSVASVTTLNSGDTSKTISGISFVSKDNWIIGETTDTNQVNLWAGDTANVTAAGKAVYLGKNAGSDNNTLILSGTLAANEFYIGSLAGNEANALIIEDTAVFTATFRLALENFLVIEGDFTDITNLLTKLDGSPLQIWDGNWSTVTGDNHTSLISSSFIRGYTTIQAIPEPSTGALLVLGAGGMLLRRRRAKA